MNYDLKNYEDACSKAKSKGKKIVLPKANELQLDIDSMEQYNAFKNRVRELNSCFHTVLSIKELQSPGGKGHYHIYITLAKEISDEERAFLQLFLSSDPIQEYLSWCLCKIGDPHPTLFFEER